MSVEAYKSRQQGFLHVVVYVGLLGSNLFGHPHLRVRGPAVPMMVGPRAGSILITLGPGATRSIASSLKGGLLGFEPKLLSYRLPVKVCVLRANLIALNLSEGSPRIGDGATGRRGTVH